MFRCRRRPGFFRIAIFTRLTTHRATLLIAVARATADDLVALYGARTDRIRVIPNGVTPDAAPSTVPREPFILAVGEFESRKRIMELIRGFRAYRDGAPPDPPPCDLVLVGSGGSQADDVAAAADDHVRLTGFIDDAALADLYRRATLPAFPSSYEGSACRPRRWPTVARLVAQNSSLIEVGGDAAIPLEDPSADGIARALTDTLSDRDALAARGDRSRHHAQMFDWDDVARRTLDVYRETMR